MAQGRFTSLLASNKKQKMMTAKVIDVLGIYISVKLSNTGEVLKKLNYYGLIPQVGDQVLIDYRNVVNPIAWTTTESFPANLKEKKETVQQFLKTA